MVLLALHLDENASDADESRNTQSRLSVDTPIRPKTHRPNLLSQCRDAPPSPEIFQVRLADYVPGYEEEGADMEKDATDEESSDEEEDRASEAKS